MTIFSFDNLLQNKMISMRPPTLIKSLLNPKLNLVLTSPYVLQTTPIVCIYLNNKLMKNIV